MIKTDMIVNALPEYKKTNDPRYFTITYNYYNDKRQYIQTTAKMIALSFNDATNRLSEVLGGRTINVETHDNGGDIHGVTPAVMRRYYKKNKPWLIAEERQAERQVKQDTAAAKRSAKLTVGAEVAKRLRHII